MKKVGIIAVSVMAMLCAKCVTSGRLQGLSPSCALHAIANAVEIQTRKPIIGEERMKAWYGSRHSDFGMTFHEAFAVAKSRGWVPNNTWLKVRCSLLDIETNPLLCTIGQHAITVISANADTVTYLDPLRIDPVVIKRATLEKVVAGEYYQIVFQGAK